MRWHRLISSTVVCALPLALIACGEQTPSDPRTDVPLVRTVAVQEATSGSRTFTGIVAARVQSDLGFRVSGKVLERLVDSGQTVKRGQPLLRIDAVDLKLAAHALQEAVAAARARAKQATEDEVRYRDLRGTGAISASTYDQIAAAADAAKAQLKVAEAQADVASNASRYTELVADGDGVVIETLAETGQVVNAGQIVVRLAHAGQREAIIQLPETLHPVANSVGQATLFGNDSVAVPAKLRQLSAAANPLTRTFDARYVLEGKLANAPLGATVTIQIPDNNSVGQNSVQVPIGSLFDAGKGSGVWVIHGQPTKVSWRPVVVQHLSDDSARIVGQLKQGEQIVALGAHLLREGEQVRVAATTIAGVQP